MDDETSVFNRPQTEFQAGMRFFGLLLVIILHTFFLQWQIHNLRDEIKQGCAANQSKPG